MEGVEEEEEEDMNEDGGDDEESELPDPRLALISHAPKPVDEDEDLIT